MFCDATEAAVRAFQNDRGLHVTGTCDEITWTALVEAGWRLGDRRLLLTSPNLRGDDVADLQHHLGRLGFDCGRVDGIFGPRTSHALHDFQSNCGLMADAVCGPATVLAIERVIGHTGSGPGVGAVREREALRRGHVSLADCRIAIGQFGGLSALTRPITRALRELAASVMALDEPDALVQADAANHYGADVYLGFEAMTGAAAHPPRAEVRFYRVPTFESAGGRALAETLTEQLAICGQVMAEPRGMRVPILRETRMPAVVVSLDIAHSGPMVAPHTAEACVRALQLWVTSREG